MNDTKVILKVFWSIFLVILIFLLTAFYTERPFELEYSWNSWLLALGMVAVSTFYIFKNTEIDSSSRLYGTFPFRRFFARSVDAFLVLIIIILVTILIKPSLSQFWLDYLNSSGSRGYMRTMAVTVLVGYACIIFEIPVIKSFGTTPGKWLFGIYLTDISGEKLSLEQVKGRSFSVFSRGMAFCIDIAYYIAAVLSYFRLVRYGQTRWDEIYQVKVHQKAWSPLRAFACVYAVLIMLGVMTLFTLYGRV
jgi:uncharacterized RDD family membrane protein YckC